MEIPEIIQSDLQERNNLNSAFIMLANMINMHVLIMEKNDQIIQKLINNVEKMPKMS